LKLIHEHASDVTIANDTPFLEKHFLQTHYTLLFLSQPRFYLAFSSKSLIMICCENLL
jgi:hypothetical protein